MRHSWQKRRPGGSEQIFNPPAASASHQLASSLTFLLSVAECMSVRCGIVGHPLSFPPSSPFPSSSLLPLSFLSPPTSHPPKEFAHQLALFLTLSPQLPFRSAYSPKYSSFEYNIMPEQIGKGCSDCSVPLSALLSNGIATLGNSLLNNYTKSACAKVDRQKRDRQDSKGSSWRKIKKFS